MDELKNTIVTVEQGGLNLDDSVMSIPEGDSREVSNVMIYENGKAEGILGYEKVHTVTNGKTIENACTDENGNVYIIEGTSTFSIFKNGVKFFETTDTLFDITKKVQFEAHDGYLFITQNGYEPLMIDIQKNIDFYGRTAVRGTQSFSSEGNYLFYVLKSDWSGQFTVSDYVSVLLPSNRTNEGNINVKGEIVDISEGMLSYHIKLDYIVEKGVTPSIGGYMVKGDVDYYPYYETLTTAKPIPLKEPDVTMVTDSSIGYNNFIEHNYVFGYSFVYDDNYETPISPLSVVDINAIKQSVLKRDGVNTFNKASIYINPYFGVDKVKIYAKKDSESENFYLITVQDFKPEIVYEWDGSLVEDILDNSTWVKGSESVPIYAKTMTYLSDDSLCYAGCTEGYEVGDIKIMSSFTQTNYDVTVSAPTIIATDSITNVGDGTVVDFVGKISWSTATTNGIIKLYLTSSFDLNGETMYDEAVGTTEYAVGDTTGDILNRIITDVNDNNLRVLLTRYPNATANYILVEPKSEAVYIATQGFIHIIEKTVVCEKSLKPDYEEQFGIVFKDRAGRRSGVVTNDSCKITINRVLYNNGISIWKPKILINGLFPTWATSAQFVVKRNTKSWTQHIVPCKGTLGTWDTTSPADSLAIKEYGNGVYGVALNRAISETQDGTTNALIYQYNEGDYIKLIRYYNTVDGWWNVFDNNLYRITGTKEDTGITYFLIDDIDGSFDNVNDIYTNSANIYLQFEIVNVGNLTLTSDNVWIEIGNSITSISGNSDTRVYPEDGQTYTFNAIEVDYGRCLIRPVFRGNLDLEPTFSESNLYIESEYIFDSSKVKLLNTGRPNVVTKNEQVFRNIIRVGGKKFDETEIDNRRVFDYRDYTTIGDNYGEITRVVQRGSTLRVYCPRRTGSVYLNADEVSYQDGSSNLVYSANKLGKMRWNDSKYGCSEFQHIVSSGNNIYFFDNNVKEFLVDTTGGIFGISGKSGERDYKVSSFFDATSLICGYDPMYRMVWVTNDTQTMAFFEDYGRWKSFYTIAPTLYFNHSNQLYSLNSNGVFKHHVSGNNTYNSAGTLSNTDPVFDFAIGAERPLTRNYEAVVLHSDDKYDVYVNCYTKNWTDDLYTKIPSGTFKKWEDLFYADVNKGGNEGTFKSYMMYEGKDMVGKVAMFKVVGDMELSGIEVRYSNRIK